MFELDIVYIQPVSNHTYSVPLRFRLLRFWIQGLRYFFDFLGKLFCVPLSFLALIRMCSSVLKIVEFHYIRLLSAWDCYHASFRLCEIDLF